MQYEKDSKETKVADKELGRDESSISTSVQELIRKREQYDLLIQMLIVCCLRTAALATTVKTNVFQFKRIGERFTMIEQYLVEGIHVPFFF